MSTSKELTIVPENDVTRGTLAEKVQYAKLMAEATVVNGEYRNKPANILVAVEYGQALGVPAMQAISQINIIQGKPTVSADLMAALVRRAGHVLRIRESQNPLAVTATLVRADDKEHPFEVTWNMAKAERAGLVKSGSGWVKYPNQMLRARAISEVCRQGATDALMGISYTPEEMRDVQLEKESSATNHGDGDLGPEPATTEALSQEEQESAPDGQDGAESGGISVEERERFMALVSEAEDWSDGQVLAMYQWAAKNFGLDPSTVKSPADFTNEQWVAFENEMARRPKVEQFIASRAPVQATLYEEESSEAVDAEVEESPGVSTSREI